MSQKGLAPSLNDQLFRPTSVAVGSGRFSAGFTLIEVMVVIGITVVITGFLIANFSRSRIDLNQITLTTADAIRSAQSQALSGSLLGGTYRCGYGIHFSDDSYLIYAGPDSSTLDCSAEDRNYNAGADSIVRQAILPNNSLEIVLPAPDIFFEPPDPTTYIGGSSGAGLSTSVVLRRKGAQCPGADCRTITVTGSGRIQTQ